MDARDQLIQEKNIVKYVKDCLENEMENWERKEYLLVLKKSEDRIIALKKHITNYPEIFNK